MEGTSAGNSRGSFRLWGFTSILVNAVLEMTARISCQVLESEVCIAASARGFKISVLCGSPIEATRRLSGPESPPNLLSDLKQPRKSHRARLAAQICDIGPNKLSRYPKAPDPHPKPSRALLIAGSCCIALSATQGAYNRVSAQLI